MLPIEQANFPVGNKKPRQKAGFLKEFWVRSKDVCSDLED